MEITAEKLKEKIENGDKIIVDFWALFCQPCRMMKPTFDRISEEYRNEDHSVQLYTLDVEKYKEFAIEMGIKSIPTIKFFNNGKEIYSKTGLLSEDAIKNLVQNLLNE